MDKPEINNLSRFESLARDVVSAFSLDVTYNVRPDWLKNPETGKNLEIDIFIPSKRIGIEVNGIGHRLVTQRRRDMTKAALCEKEGVILFVAEHILDLKKLHHWLNRQLKTNVPFSKQINRKLYKYRPSTSAFGHLGERVTRLARREHGDYANEKEKRSGLRRMLSRGQITQEYYDEKMAALGVEVVPLPLLPPVSKEERLRLAYLAEKKIQLAAARKNGRKRKKSKTHKHYKKQKHCSHCEAPPRSRT